MADEDEAVAGLWAMAQLGTPMAVRVAATLRIADHIATGPRTATELAGPVGADPDALERLLRYLAVRGLFSRDEAGRYALTDRGQPLRSDHPGRLHPWLDIEGPGKAELAFAQLLHSIRTGEAAFPVQFGHTMWDDLTHNANRGETFNTSLGADVPDRVAAVAAAYDWGTLGHLVDVGGGNGAQLIALLNAHPTLRGTVLDRPDTAEEAREALAAAGLADRADAVAGSFFDPLPPGAGGYLLSLAVHNWADDAVRVILRRCAEAAGRDGSVLILENVGPDGESPPTGMDLRMLVYCGGKERKVSELAVLAADAGLRLAGVHPAGTFSIVELTAAA